MGFSSLIRQQWYWFHISSSDLLKDLSLFKLENMAIRLLLTGASEGWSAPGTTSQGQSASGWSMMNLLALGFISMVSTTCRFCNQGSPVNQLMMIHGRVPWQVEVPSQQMSIEANDYYRALLYEMLWEKGSQLQLDWRGSWGGLPYPAGCSQDRRKRERASDRSDSGVATEGVGVELGEMMVFCDLVRGAQIIPKAPAKTGKRGWLLIFWRVFFDSIESEIRYDETGFIIFNMNRMLWQVDSSYAFIQVVYGGIRWFDMS